MNTQQPEAFPYSKGDRKNEPSDPYHGWYRKPGTLGPDDKGRAFYPSDKHELSGEELGWHLDKMIDHGNDAHLSSQLRSAGLPKIPAEQKKDLLNGTWAGRGYDLQTREGQLHHRVHQNLAFGEVHPHIGPTTSWHKPGFCDNSARAKGSPHSHIDGVAADAEYWWLSPNGYWQSLCSRCVLVDMAVAVENPDLGPVVIIPVVHRV